MTTYFGKNRPNLTNLSFVLNPSLQIIKALDDNQINFKKNTFNIFYTCMIFFFSNFILLLSKAFVIFLSAFVDIASCIREIHFQIVFDPV